MAEHISKEKEWIYLRNLDKHLADGGLLVLSWAHPQQAGEGHINTREEDAVKDLVTGGRWTREVQAGDAHAGPERDAGDAQAAGEATGTGTGTGAGRSGGYLNGGDAASASAGVAAGRHKANRPVSSYWNNGTSYEYLRPETVTLRESAFFAWFKRNLLVFRKHVSDAT